MSLTPVLAAISIYPLKSLDGIALNQTQLLESGALQHDREFALFDAQDRFVNGKHNPQVHLLRSRLDPALQILTLQTASISPASFDLSAEPVALETWLSQFFSSSIKIKQNSQVGFPDDTNAPGPTLISTATLETVAAWYQNVSVDQMRRRLRMNLEISGVPPFWEDQLFAGSDQVVQFQIGEVSFEGINPCQRCIVPTRDAQTGSSSTDFQKRFVQQRRATLPEWANRDRFNHFYRLGVNTRVPKSFASKTLQLGDQIKIKGAIAHR
jgi:uncharacterized protein